MFKIVKRLKRLKKYTLRERTIISTFEKHKRDLLSLNLTGQDTDKQKELVIKINTLAEILNEDKVSFYNIADTVVHYPTRL